MSKPPAFQFYASDWLSSKEVALMTPAEEGAYIHLLCHAWKADDCGLPDDDKQLAILSRLGEKWLQNGCPLVKGCFIVKGDRLYNPKLLKIRKTLNDWREKSRKGGIASAKSKWGRKIGGDKVVTDCLSPNGNTSSSISSSISIKEKVNQKEKTGLTRFQTAFVEEWNEKAKNFGFTPLQKLSPSRKAALATRSKDPWWVKNYSEAIDIICWTKFYTGENDRGWKANVDYFLRPGTVLTLIEKRVSKSSAPSRPISGPTHEEQMAEKGVNDDVF